MTTWTPAARPFSTWAEDTPTTTDWSPAARLFAAWTVERTGSTQRITQDGRLRITEQNQMVRIIERSAPTTWNLDPKTFATWSTP